MSQNHFYQSNRLEAITLRLTPDEAGALVALLNDIADECGQMKRNATIYALVLSDLNTAFDARLRRAYFNNKKIRLNLPPGQAVCLFSELNNQRLSIAAQSMKDKLHKALTDKDLI
jgi:hypothetical protein